MTTNVFEEAVQPVVDVLAGAPRRRPGDSWRPVDLSVVLDDSYEQPRPTIGHVAGAEVGMFYPGRINALFGDSGGGKTWYALYVMSQEMLLGRDVVLVDYEDHPVSQVARLEQIGVPRETILRHLIYIQPNEKWSQVSERALLESLADRDVAIAVLDSTGEALAVDGVSPNADEEVARWFRGSARTLAQTGAAVVLLDHVVKSRESNRNVEFASGSQRKRAAVNGAAYFLKVISAPSKSSDGEFEMWTRKCRFGWRKHDTVACHVSMTNTDDGGVMFTVRQHDESSQPTKKVRKTWYMEAISRELKLAGAAMSKREILKAVGKTHLFTSEALETLLAEGFLTETSGPRNARMFTLVKEFTQAADEAGIEATGNPF